MVSGSGVEVLGPPEAPPPPNPTHYPLFLIWPETVPALCIHFTLAGLQSCCSGGSGEAGQEACGGCDLSCEKRKTSFTLKLPRCVTWFRFVCSPDSDKQMKHDSNVQRRGAPRPRTEKSRKYKAAAKEEERHQPQESKMW